MSYNSFNNYMKERFGGKVYRLALSCSYTCPNRDGKCSRGGCIFCNEQGSGDFASQYAMPINTQIENAKKKVENKLGKNFAGYIAYFQPFTGTYYHDAKEFAELKKKYYDAINYPEILGLSIATRPDCLPDEMIKLLSELNQIKPVWVELGLQTSNDETAAFFNRGYKTEVYDDAVRRLHDAGIQVVTHVIVGLPGEDKKDVIETVKHVGHIAHPEDGIKIQILQVLKGTQLAQLLADGRASIKEYSLEEYAAVLKELLACVPEHMIVHRLTGDPPKSLLISPLWTANKKNVINYLRSFVDSRI